MRDHSAEIDRALETLGGMVADRLSTEGWNRRLLDQDRATTRLTLPTQNGVLAVLRIGRTSWRWPEDWPVEVEASLGVGYEPALNLMPLLTLDPRAALVHDASDGCGTGVTVSLGGSDAAAGAAHQILNFVSDNVVAATENFPDAATIDAQLQRQIAAETRAVAAETATETAADSDTDDAADPDPADADADPAAADFDTQLRLVLLAAMGRHDQARELLATYPDRRDDEPIGREDRRFIRQLTRWLDAGGPPAPPVEDTLAQLPQRTRTPRPSWSDSRARSKAKKEAFDAARAQSEGKSLDELADVIAAEYASRGIEIAPSVVAVQAEMLRVERQPFGRARTGLRAIRMIASIGAGAIRLIKHGSGHDLEWLQPPDRAAYPMIAGRHRYTSIELDAAADAWLERVHLEAPRRTGPWILIDVWLTREDPAGPTVAHIGEQRVGIVRPDEAKEFDHVMRAAALFDEYPFARGRLIRANGGGRLVLEIPLPESLRVHPED